MLCHNQPNFGIWGEIWGILPGIANAALDFFGRPDHVLQEKHLLQSPPGSVCPYIQLLVYQLSPNGSCIGFSGFAKVIKGVNLPNFSHIKVILGHILLALGGIELVD